MTEAAVDADSILLGQIETLHMAWKATDKFALLISAKDAKTSRWSKARLCLTIWLPTSHCRTELRFLADTKELFVEYFALRMSFKSNLFWTCCYASTCDRKSVKTGLLSSLPSPCSYTAAEKFCSGSYVFSHTLSLLVKFCLEYCKIKKNCIDRAVVACRDLAESSLFVIVHQYCLWNSVAQRCCCMVWNIKKKRIIARPGYCIWKKKKKKAGSDQNFVKWKKKECRWVVGLVTGHTGVTV